MKPWCYIISEIRTGQSHSTTSFLSGFRFILLALITTSRSQPLPPWDQIKKLNLTQGLVVKSKSSHYLIESLVLSIIISLLVTL